MATLNHETDLSILALSRWVDGSAAYAGVCEETALWRRSVGKLTEEVGEVSVALNGSVGENPRKGVTHGIEDVEYELLDVALTALGAVCHLHGNTDVEPMRLLADHVAKVRARAGV